MIPSQLVQFASPTKVLDHGFVRLVDVMGDDGAIVEAARMSTTGLRSEHKWKELADGRNICAVCNRARVWVHDHDEWAHDPVCLEGDRRLIRYMARNGHTSPFEMCEVKLHVKLPIFVARQWVRHRTWSFNEFSGRYSEMPDEVFKVAQGAWRTQDTINRQGSAGVVTNYPPMSSDWVKNGGQESRWGVAVPGRMGGFQGPDNVNTAGEYLSYRQWEVQDHAREVYEERLAFDVSKELARVDLPLSYYTQWTCKTDLHNLAHFLKLRLDEHAQPEIRVYAEVIRDIVAAWVPLAWEALRDWRVEGATLSRQQVQALRMMAQGNTTGADIVRECFGDAHRAEGQSLLKLLGLL